MAGAERSCVRSSVTDAQHVPEHCGGDSEESPYLDGRKLARPSGSVSGIPRQIQNVGGVLDGARRLLQQTVEFLVSHGRVKPLHVTG
jgi:hypothetical protein